MQPCEVLGTEQPRRRRQQSKGPEAGRSLVYQSNAWLECSEQPRSHRDESEFHPKADEQS